MKKGLTDDEIFPFLEEEHLTEEFIQSILQRHMRIKRGEIKIPDCFLDYLLNPNEDDDEEWEDE